ncbi:MAG: hypothetical protein R2713_11125 [Ilumatobacteraceae bacterium]
MAAYTTPVQVLIDELGRLPGIGPKSAQRIAFHLLKVPADDVARLAHALTEAKAKVRFCARCWNIADDELCPICADERRDPTTVCVVEEARDIVAIERRRVPWPGTTSCSAMSPLRGHRARAVEGEGAVRPDRGPGDHRRSSCAPTPIPRVR